MLPHRYREIHAPKSERLIHKKTLKLQRGSKPSRRWSTSIKKCGLQSQAATSISRNATSFWGTGCSQTKKPSKNLLLKARIPAPKIWKAKMIALLQCKFWMLLFNYKPQLKRIKFNWVKSKPLVTQPTHLKRPSSKWPTAVRKISIDCRMSSTDRKRPWWTF